MPAWHGSGVLRRVFGGPPRFALLASLLALPLVASTGMAQGEVALSWSDCPPSGGTSAQPNCQFDIGERRLYLGFVPGVDVTDVVGWTLVLDLASNSATLPAWWQVQPGGCRDGQLSAVMPTGFELGCIDAWSATGSVVIQSFLYPRPGGDGRQLRLVVGVGVPAGQAFTLAAGESYLAGSIAIHYAKTTLPGGCEGCTEPVCFVFNSAEIVRHPGAAGEGPQPFVTPLAGAGNQATWGAAAECSTVPARARTWGQIKSLYH